MSSGASVVTADRRGLTGAACAAGAFGLWGAFPLYFKAVASVPAAEVLGHRIVWSVLCVALLLFVVRQWPEVRCILRDRRRFMALVATALLISINWLVFIWAVADDRVLEASLGYYITPLVSVLFGRLFLGERLWRTQWTAVVLAGIGVGYMLVALGYLPWVSLVLAASFGAYGLIRKIVNVGAVAGLFVETLIVGPVALTYLLVLAVNGDGTFGRSGIDLGLLLLAGGLITAVPLILYAQSVRRLRLASIGLFQYATPTIQMLIAVLVFGELFTSAHLVTFTCIWLALALYSTSAWLGRDPRPPVMRNV